MKTVTLLAALLITTAAAQTQTYPDLPTGIKNGVGGLIGTTIYAGLGTAGQKFYALNLSDSVKGWAEMAAFPGPARDQASAAVVSGKLYVFGGMGKTTPEATSSVFNQVHAYDPASNTWQELKTRAPVDIGGGTAVAQGDSILLFGGVNRNIFNGYFTDIAAAGTDKAASDAVALAYFSGRPQDYFFGKDVQSYTPATNTWQSLGTAPFTGRAGAAISLQGDTLTVVSGEIKPGLRTAQAGRATVKDGAVSWSEVSNLPGAADGAVQEGVAGAFTGSSMGALLVAGGANFPGSTAKFRSGVQYAHQGLTKTWRSDIYALRGDKWSVVGQLPQPQASGISIQRGDEVILVGGEVQGGDASTKVMSITLKGDSVEIKD
ncbi:N-acetylneuraminate epimerase [Deinococcus marmoris]|uniref:Sialic acid-induced transmembrane protein n=1 Tax=Deinococcus marmoris TaxID=249408 RepID=A0A1U7NWP8_9DEIO|nr:N-acetylneuraminate epimerase [Deinococcus marmoris]OLV17330.1 Sialic acid-induced transmembrane protein [Deinococcus marmoris]